VVSGLVLAAGLAGCASSSKQVDRDPGLIDVALKAVGLQRAQDEPAAGAELSLPKLRSVPLRVHAGQVLNTDPSGQSLALVARVYRLRDAEAFLQTPYEAFGDPAREASAIGRDLVSVREVVLKPGGRHESTQNLDADVQYIGVVGLFRSPAEHRWRFVFDARESAGGIVLGAHGCALSVSEGRVVGTSPEMTRLAGVQCD